MPKEKYSIEYVEVYHKKCVAEVTANSKKEARQMLLDHHVYVYGESIDGFQFEGYREIKIDNHKEG